MPCGIIPTTDMNTDYQVGRLFHISYFPFGLVHDFFLWPKDTLQFWKCLP